jgi:hypothetical protein
MRMAGAVVSIMGVIVLARSFDLTGAGLASVVTGATYTVGVLVAFTRLRRRGPSDAACGPGIATRLPSRPIAPRPEAMESEPSQSQNSSSVPKL